MKKIIYALATTLIAGQVFAQNEYDALRFSQTYQSGSARSVSMGGAFGALGGDISVMSINPAGIGIFQSPTVAITPSFYANTVKTTPSSGISEDDKYTMKFSNLGFVVATSNGNTTGFTGFSWGIGYNILNDFTANETFRYNNASSSMLDALADRAYGIYPDNLSQFNTYQAYDTYLLDNPDKETEYVNAHSKIWGGKGIYGETQKRYMTQKGGINSWDFTFAASFYKKFYFGASLGLQSVNYKATSNYTEEDNCDCAPYDYWTFKENFKTNGAGINLKVGFLVKPVNYLRFGAAIHTPTIYTLTEKYYSSTEAQFDENIADTEKNNFQYISDNNEYEYNLYSPFKAILSGAFIVPGYGLLSLDYEYVDYTKCKFEPSDNDTYTFEIENAAIKDKFQKTKNLRLGIEGLVGPMAIRAGYAMYGNPFNMISGDIQRSIISGGLGFKGESIVIDLAAAYHIYQTDSYLYESNKPEHSQIISYDNRYLQIMLTVGFRL